MTDAFKNTLMWLLIGTIAVFMAMNWASASFTGADYLPAGNDSFYHARRILDTWQDPSAFYEFDPRIHVPEGSWIVWPWLYDYLMARTLQVVTWITGAQDPMPALVYLPVFWAYVTIGLILTITAALRLPYILRIVGGLFAALLPLNQVLHGVGRVDHHFMEYTFVLLTLVAGMNWFALGRSRGFAALTGYSMGIACGFHNALFVLQIPVLLAFFICWVRGCQPDRGSTVWMVGSLLVGSLLVLVPSIPFLQGRFDFYLLSWFHLYIAVCTGVAMLYMSWRPFSWRAFGVLAALGLLLVVPIVGQILVAGDFFAQRVNRLANISEAKSVLRMLKDSQGSFFLKNVYSYMIFAVPLIVVGTATGAVRSRQPAHIIFYVFSTLGLVLLVTQFRFHYYGSFAMCLPVLLWAWSLAQRFPGRSRLILGLTVVLFAVALYPAVRYRLFVEYRSGLDAQYQLVRDMLPILKERCEKRPGVVLSYNDAGHYVRFHTECSVIANNFLLTPQQSDKIRELDELLSLPVEEVVARRPDIVYLLIYYPTLIYDDPTTGAKRLLTRDELAGAPWTMIKQLMFSEDPEKDFPQLELLWQVNSVEDDGTRFPIGRLYEVKPQDDKTEDTPAGPKELQPSG